MKLVAVLLLCAVAIPGGAQVCATAPFERAPDVELLAGKTFVAATAADLDGDTIIDVAVTFTGVSGPVRDGVAILFGTGDGTFRAPQTVPTYIGSTEGDITAADWDADGDIDLLVTMFGNSVRLLSNDGNGLFSEAGDFRAGFYPAALAAVDFNSDGYLDAAVANVFGDTLTILMGERGGGFASPRSLPIPDQLDSVVTGDFDGDGDVDVATGGSRGVYVALNDSDGTFRTSGPVADSGRSGSLGAVDANRDGYVDVVSVRTGGEVDVLYGNSSGTLSVGASLSGLAGTAVLVADLNGDARGDLVLARPADDSVAVVMASAGGDFLAPAHFATGDNPTAMAAGDLNGDGQRDLVVLNQRARSLSVLLNTCHGAAPVPTLDWWFGAAMAIFVVAAAMRKISSI